MIPKYISILYLEDIDINCIISYNAMQWKILNIEINHMVCIEVAMIYLEKLTLGSNIYSSNNYIPL